MCYIDIKKGKELPTQFYLKVIKIIEKWLDMLPHGQKTNEWKQYCKIKAKYCFERQPKLLQ